MRPNFTSGIINTCIRRRATDTLHDLRSLTAFTLFDMVSPLDDDYEVTSPSLGLGSNHSRCRYDLGCGSCNPAMANVSRSNRELAEEVHKENKKNSTLYRIVPQELLDKIVSNLSLSSVISAKSSCRLFSRCGPPLCRLTTTARNDPLVVFDLRCKSEKPGELGKQPCCSYCKDIHDPAMFSKRHQAKSPYQRQCKGGVYYMELNPHWFMGFRQLGNLIAGLSPYTSYVTPPGQPNPRIWTFGSTPTLPGIPGYDSDDSDIMVRHGQPFLCFCPEGSSELYSKRNFSLPAVPVVPSPGQPPYAFFPLHVSAAWLRKADESIILVSKWTLRKDIQKPGQWDITAILAEMRQHTFNLCPHIQLNDHRLVHAVREYHGRISSHITVPCVQCTTVIRLSSSKQMIPVLPTHASHKVVLIVERTLGRLRTPMDPKWLNQLVLETENGGQNNQPLCQQGCCYLNA